MRVVMLPFAAPDMLSLTASDDDDNAICYVLSVLWMTSEMQKRSNNTKNVKNETKNKTLSTRSPAIAEGPRDAGVPVEIW